MPLPFGTAEWARALEDQINGSSEYRNAGARWGVGWNGNVLLAFEADAQLAAPRYLLIRLEGGTCTGTEFATGSTHPEAGFGLRAPFSLWRQVLEGKTLAASLILTGRMRVDGDKMTLLKHAAAHRSLLHCAASLDTLFPTV